MLAPVQHPPVVRLPGHPAGAGYLLEWRRTAAGEWQALVEIADIAPGWTGGLQGTRTTWLQAREVQRVDGEDYSRVPRTRA